MKKTLATFISLFMCLSHTTGLCFVSYSPPILETRNWKLETVSLSADPMELEGGLNLYAYCDGDPLTYIDPLGLCAQTESSFWENLVTGAVAGDFADDTGWGGLLGQVGVGLIPGVGQVADIRDIAANGKDFWNEPSWGAAAGVVGSAIGFVPLFGDLAKGAIKGGKTAAKEVGQAALKNVDNVAKANVKVLQTGGNIINADTAKALGKELNMHPKEVGNALERLKDANEISHSTHGKIMSNGDYYVNGVKKGNIGDYKY